MRELEINESLFLVTDEPGIAFTTRVGGQSPEPFEGMNLGFATGDDVERVRSNRQSVASALQIDDQWVTGHQIHGADVLEAAPIHAGGPPPRPIADAIVTRHRDLPIAVLTADCLPVALVNDSRAAAVHVGWRGLCGGVIQAAAKACGPGLRAYLGPSIGPCHYVVGNDVPEAFKDAFPGAPGFASWRDGTMRFDLRKAAVWILRQIGIEVDTGDEIPCTSCDPRFYSFRRDGVTGRQGLIVWR